MYGRHRHGFLRSRQLERVTALRQVKGVRIAVITVAVNEIPDVPAMHLLLLGPQIVVVGVPLNRAVLPNTGQAQPSRLAEGLLSVQLQGKLQVLSLARQGVIVQPDDVQPLLLHGKRPLAPRVLLSDHRALPFAGLRQRFVRRGAGGKAGALQPNIGHRPGSLLMRPGIAAVIVSGGRDDRIGSVRRLRRQFAGRGPRRLQAYHRRQQHAGRP